MKEEVLRAEVSVAGFENGPEELFWQSYLVLDKSYWEKSYLVLKNFTWSYWEKSYLVLEKS